jgi:hypothetical protein
MNKAAQPKIYVAGHRGMGGSPLVRNLLAEAIASEKLIARNRKDFFDQSTGCENVHAISISAE